MPRTLSESLAHAVTEYDRKQERQAARRRNGYHNPNALGLYLIRVDAVCADVSRGAPIAEAVARGFSDRLLTAIEQTLISDGHISAPAERLNSSQYHPVTRA